MWILLAVLAVLVAIALAALRYGVDSRTTRPGERSAPHRRGPTLFGDLKALVRRTHQSFEALSPRIGMTDTRPSASRRSAEQAGRLHHSTG
jgi:hypothetical protein